MKDSSMWWHERREELIDLCTDSFPLIVYNEETLNDLFFDLLSMDSIDRHLYAVWSNPHPGTLRKAFEMGLDFLIGNIKEQKHVEASCPGIGPERFFFTPEARSFPKISIRNRSGNFQESPESFLGDLRDYLNEIERIREGYPDSEIWFTCGTRELAPAGVLITRVAGQMEERNGFMVPLGEELSGRIGLNNDPVSMKIFSLSGFDLNPAPLRYSLERDREEVEVKCRIEAPACIKEGDVLLIPGVGASKSMGKDGMSLAERDQRSERFLRARRMCQVKL